MNQVCRVCGEPAAGFHFGAFTCEGCKSFFGRTYNSAGNLGECKSGGGCVINKRNRTACKVCRLRKCLAAGMSKSGSRYGRRSNWFKIHCLLQEKAASLSAALDRNPKTDQTLAIQEAKRALQGLSSPGLGEIEPKTDGTQTIIKEEDCGAESPNLSSPDSHLSDGSIDSSLDFRRPFQLYPKLGILSPFFLHAGSPLTSPSSPYPHLPFFPYLYPVLGGHGDRQATPPLPFNPVLTHALPEPSKPSHPLMCPTFRDPPHMALSSLTKPTTHNPHLHPPTPTTTTHTREDPHSTHNTHRSHPIHPQIEIHRRSKSPKAANEADQDEPIDLSVRRTDTTSWISRKLESVAPSVRKTDSLHIRVRNSELLDLQVQKSELLELSLRKSESEDQAIQKDDALDLPVQKMELVSSLDRNSEPVKSPVCKLEPDPPVTQSEEEQSVDVCRSVSPNANPHLSQACVTYSMHVTTSLASETKKEHTPPVDLSCNV